MKKIILSIVCIIICIILTGCGDTPNISINAYKDITQETTVDSALSFKTLATYADYKIVYNEKTKVMYGVSFGSSNRGTMTLLVNADGTPMIWE